MTPVTQQARPLARPAATLVWLLAMGVPTGMLALVAVSPTPEQDAWAIPLYSGIVATWGLPNGAGLWLRSASEAER